MLITYFIMLLVSFMCLQADIEITAPKAHGSLKTERLVYERPTVVYHKTITITALELEAFFDTKASQALKSGVMSGSVRLVDDNKTITCARAEYNHATQKLTLTGDVTISYHDGKKVPGAFAQADIVVYDSVTREVTLNGKNKPVTTVITTS